MQLKLQTKAFEQVAPMLMAGERPLVATRVSVGKFTSGRLSAVVRNGLVLEGGGLVAAALLQARKQFIVVTDRRLIFLTQTFMGGPGKKVLGEVPREEASLAEAKLGTVSLVRISFGALGDGVALTFPLVDKKNAVSLAQALQPAPVA